MGMETMLETRLSTSGRRKGIDRGRRGAKREETVAGREDER
jgi:hypothetical protein